MSTISFAFIICIIHFNRIFVWHRRSRERTYTWTVEERAESFVSQSIDATVNGVAIMINIFLYFIGCVSPSLCISLYDGEWRRCCILRRLGTHLTHFHIWIARILNKYLLNEFETAIKYKIFFPSLWIKQPWNVLNAFASFHSIQTLGPYPVHKIAGNQMSANVFQPLPITYDIYRFTRSEY